VLIEQIHLTNLLSFGPDMPTLPLRSLNVLIGPNASGKSNLIEAISLLQSAPGLLASPVRDGGGIREWLWKGARHPTAKIDAIINYPQGKMSLRHVLSFTESGQRFELIDERIENEKAYAGRARPYFYYSYEHNRPVLNVNDKRRSLRREDVDPEKSILAQRKDPDQYPEITYLGEQYEQIRIYRDWSFGRYTPPRQPQKADQRNDYLTEDSLNLGLILNRLRREPTVKGRLLELLNKLYPGINDFDVIVEGGTVQVFFQEGSFTIPATRLSDGTLRYLCLLAILCHPQPPPLVCIEEPELGLHPDVLASLGELLKQAALHMQLIVTTHSEILIDALSNSPEDVIVCEKENGQTLFRRLEQEPLKEWLKKYTLGQLWRRGEIGGNRW
jgi:predicted ATPase